MPSVVLINPFEVPPGSEDEFLEAWSDAAGYMRRQSGFIRSRQAPSCGLARFPFVNVAGWASREDLQRAISQPEFAGIAARVPGSNPELYEVVGEERPAARPGRAEG